MPVHEVYLILAEELAARGVDPESDAVFDGALVISRGRKPAVLAGLSPSGGAARQPWPQPQLDLG